MKHAKDRAEYTLYWRIFRF